MIKKLLFQSSLPKTTNIGTIAEAIDILVTDVLLPLAGVSAVAAAIMSGYHFIWGDKKKGKDGLQWVAVGIAVVTSSYVIIDFVRRTFQSAI